MIGHTIWFYIEIRFSYFEPPLLFCNGDSKNENLNSLHTHELGKTAKKPTVMSISPWIGPQTVVRGALNTGKWTLKQIRGNETIEGRNDRWSSWVF